MKQPADIIKEVQVTEKGTALTAAANQYVFEVDRDANKIQIRQAVEALFDVKVKAVNTMRYAGKRKRERTARYGRRADWKRAVVTLREGSTIELA